MIYGELKIKINIPLFVYYKTVNSINVGLNLL